MRKFLFLFVYCLLFSFPDAYSRGTDLDSLVLNAVETGDILAINDCLERGIDINAFYGENKLTLIAVSIASGQSAITELLIQQGADIEQNSDRKTPLMFAAKYNRAEVVPMLILGGANINSINKQKTSALHYAAKYGHLELVKVLCEKGAYVNLMDDDGWTALDFAIIGRRDDIENYLTSVGGKIYNKILPSFLDGPYMEIIQPDQLNVFYLTHDSLENKSRIISEPIDFNTPPCSVSGLDEEEKKYIIDKDFTAPQSVYKDVSRIMAIGDIHGQYSRMILMLKKAGVIDDNLQWQWGDGHLVFIGDIFDRGNEVTECLWFIYNLEKQADLYHGKVHLLLGNHEIMVLNGDIRYISNKYYGITTNLKLDYSLLYSRNTIIGRWLRSKNTIEKINNLIFVHAGISPQLAAENLSLDSVNYVIRDILDGNSDAYPEDFQDFLMGDLGPVWYRGYLQKSRHFPKINPTELSNILSAYEAESIVIGHTERDSVNSLFNSAVISINLPLWNEDIPVQALLIENNQFYRIYANGIREIIH